MQDRCDPVRDHPIRVENSSRRVEVRVAGHVFARTDDALILRETDLAPVVYVPRKDVDLTRLSRNQHTTRCPYKGTACYFDASVPGTRVERVAWSYENPCPAVSGIKDALAFRPQLAEILEM